MVFDDTSVYGFARKPAYLCQSPVLEYQLYAAEKGVTENDIKSVRKTNDAINQQSKKRNAAAADWGLRSKYTRGELSATQYKWVQEGLPVYARAMTLADRTLFIAGPPDVVDEVQAFYAPDDADIRSKLFRQREAWEGRRGAQLLAVSIAGGDTLAAYPLESPPVWDGMAAAKGQLFLATVGGKVLCFGESAGTQTAAGR
jgi:hypothetical protein